MGNIIATNTGKMREDIETYNTQVGLVDKAFNEAWEAVDALNATWGGPAHDLLIAQFSADREVMKELIAMLKSCGNEVENAKRAYELCENNVNSVIKSLRV